MYSDIVKLSQVGNSQVPIMGFLQIKVIFNKVINWYSIPWGCQGQEKEYQNYYNKHFRRNWWRVSYSRRCGNLSPQLLQPMISGLDLYKEPRLELWLFVNFITMNSRIKFYKAAFFVRGNGFDIPAFSRILRY